MLDLSMHIILIQYVLQCEDTYITSDGVLPEKKNWPKEKALSKVGRMLT